MIIQEPIFEKLILTKSDSGFTIVQNETGIEYDEAIDAQPIKYTYTETEKIIVPEDEEEN